MNLPPGGVLAFDLSTHVGWCYGPLTERLPIATGTCDLPTFNGTKLGLGSKVPYGTLGHRLSAFSLWLVQNFLAVGRKNVVLPKQIVYEEILPPAGFTDIAACRLLYGLSGQLEREANDASVPITYIGVRSIRHEVFGAALNGVSRNKLKGEIVRLIRHKGIAVTDHNQADAAAVWLCYKQRQTHGAGPLWEEYAA